MLTSTSQIFSQAKTFIRLNENELDLHKVDFWMILILKNVGISPETLMNILKFQFEFVNIIKVEQSFYLDTPNKGFSQNIISFKMLGTEIVTGWKLSDKNLADEILKKSKKLMLELNRITFLFFLKNQ